MKTTFLLLFAMLLSALGLSSSPPQPLSPSPSAEIVRPIAKVATATRAAVKTPVKKPMPKKTPVATSSVQVSVAVSSAPIVTPSAPIDFNTHVEQEVFMLMNAERAKQNLPAFIPNVTLTSIARLHSADMLAKHYFSHEDSTGCSTSCRADNAGYTWRAIGENIYMMEGYELSAQKTAEMVVDGWMHSPGHRANILGNQFTESGVGIAQSGDSVYITVDYGSPR